MIPHRKNNLEKAIQEEQREYRGLHLPYRQRRLVALYDGTNTEHIARMLGVAQGTVNNWLKDPRVVEAIAKRDDIEDSPVIAGRIERKEFWSHVMISETFEIRDRLKASELLGKSECDFSETRILKGAGASTTVIVNTGVPRAPGDPQPDAPHVTVSNNNESQEVDTSESEATVIVVPAWEEIF